MEQKLWIPGPLPGQNEFVESAKGFKGSGRGYTTLKSQWTGLVKSRAIAARLKPIGAARFFFEWHEPSKARNPDNICAGIKPVLDGLVVAKLLQNDGWAQILEIHHSWRVDKLRPGVMVTIISEDSAGPKAGPRDKQKAARQVVT